MTKSTQRNTYTVDATNRPLGRLAVHIALLLRGKEKVEFAPHKDAGDFVVVKNVRRMKFSGQKLSQKMYRRHSGYLGSLRETKLESAFSRKPEEVLRKAVWGMLPKNKLRSPFMKRLTIE